MSGVNWFPMGVKARAAAPAFSVYSRKNKSSSIRNFYQDVDIIQAQLPKSKGMLFPTRTPAVTAYDLGNEPQLLHPPIAKLGDIG